MSSDTALLVLGVVALVAYLLAALITPDRFE